MVTKKIYHAAIYVRLSKEDGDVANAGKAESNSISNQKNLIKDFLKDKEDIIVVSERVDDGYSGSNFQRPAFGRMMEDAKKGENKLHYCQGLFQIRAGPFGDRELSGTDISAAWNTVHFCK